jgi:trehalose-phosphatase
MRVLTPALDLHHFLARIPSATERVLMLDYDGTLAPFQPRPDQARPYPGVARALGRLMSDGRTRVVVISGRRATEVVPLLALDRHPEIWGCHGWERLSLDGELQLRFPPENARAALEEGLRAARPLTRRGARLECKPASVALHWRGLSALSIGRIREDALPMWSPLARETGMDLLVFDGGLELCARRLNHQHAVKAVLSETGPESVVAYLGDDLTDEYAFDLIKPRGIGVLVRPDFRETSADVWIRPPRELIAFLGEWTARGAGA